MIGPVPYIGGKNRLWKSIVDLFPKHGTYVEPFFGGGQVFFRKEPSPVEVINDLSGEVVNFFRICQSHHEELIRTLRFMIVARNWFDLLKRTDPSTLTDVQRAARFLYLQKTSFAGRIVRQNYAVHVIQRPTFDPERLREAIGQTHQRLANVQIENLPYENVIRRYDRAETLFYLDPPYWQKQLYQFNFSDEQFRGMASLLRAIKGKFLLSVNDNRELRNIFADFRIRSVRLHYTSQKLAGRRYAELIIRNF